MSGSQAASSFERFPCVYREGPNPLPPEGWSWEGLMELALKEARSALAQGEVPVGALVVDMKGTILGRGHNASIAEHDISAHAEIMALRAAGKKFGNYRFSDQILVATLEPCAMCAAAIVQARLAGVVFGAVDRLCGAVVSCAEYLDPPCSRGQMVWHMGGILGERCGRLLTDFFKTRREV